MDTHDVKLTEKEENLLMGLLSMSDTHGEERAQLIDLYTEKLLEERNDFEACKKRFFMDY